MLPRVPVGRGERGQAPLPELFCPWSFIEPFIAFAFHNWNTTSNHTIQISQLQLSSIQIAQVK